MTRGKSDIDHGYAWVVMAASFGIEVIAGMLYGCLGFLTTAILEAVEDNLTRASIVSSTMLGTFTLFGPIAGVIQDRIGHRLTGIVSGVLMLIGNVAASFCRSILGLVLTFGIITGLGLGLAVNLSGVAPGNYFDKKLPVVYGICMSGGGFGIFVVGPFMVFLLELYSLSGTLLILGGVAFHVCLAGAFIRPSSQIRSVEKETSVNIDPECDEPCLADDANCAEGETETGLVLTSDILADTLQNEESQHNVSNYEDSGEGRTATETLMLEGDQPSETDDVKQTESNSMAAAVMKGFVVLRSNGFFLYAISTLFWSMGESGCMVHLPNYVEHKGSTATQSASVLTVLGITSIFSGTLAGFTASDPSIGKILLHAGFLGMSGILNVLLPLYSHTFQLQMVFGALYGVYSQAPYSITGPICIELAGLSNLAMAYGLYCFALGLGYLLGPPIASLLYDTSGIYDYTYVFAGCCMFASAFSAAFIPMFKSDKAGGVKP